MSFWWSSWSTCRSLRQGLRFQRFLQRAIQPENPNTPEPQNPWI
jgi:hypothetical protein